MEVKKTLNSELRVTENIDPHTKIPHMKNDTENLLPTYMPTRKISHGKIPTRKNSQSEKFSFGTFLPCKITTRKFSSRKIPTSVNCHKMNIFRRYAFSLVTLNESFIVNGLNLELNNSGVFNSFTGLVFPFGRQTPYRDSVAVTTLLYKIHIYILWCKEHNKGITFILYEDVLLWHLFPSTLILLCTIEAGAVLIKIFTWRLYFVGVITVTFTFVSFKKTIEDKWIYQCARK